MKEFFLWRECSHKWLLCYSLQLCWSQTSHRWADLRLRYYKKEKGSKKKRTHDCLLRHPLSSTTPHPILCSTYNPSKPCYQVCPQPAVNWPLNVKSKNVCFWSALKKVYFHLLKLLIYSVVSCYATHLHDIKLIKFNIPCDNYIIWLYSQLRGGER